MSRTITITSGKGGVGKTNISLNLGLHLSNQGYKICLFDADLGLGNINVLLGLQPECDLSDVILNDQKLEDIFISVNENFDILPGSSGMEEMANLEAERLEVLIESLSGLNRYDFLLFDTSAGISKSVISLCLASSEVVLVIAPEPTSLTDSFALLKILSLNGFPGQARVVVNQCKSSEIAAMAYKKFKSAAVKYLNIDVPTLGMIYQDPKVAEAVKQQQPLLSLYPDSSASKCIRQIGERLLSAGMEHLKQDDMVSFWSRCRQLMSGPLKLPSSKKESGKHSPEPVTQESKSKMHQVAKEDRQEDLPDKRSDSAAAAGLASEKPTAQSSTSSLEETQQLTNAQVLESSKPAETANLQRLLLLMETVIGAVSSLTKELELVRKAIARHEKSSLSRESFLFELTPKA